MFSKLNKYLSGPHLIRETFEGMGNIKSIDAAFVWTETKALYLFKGEKYWRYHQAGSGMRYRVANGYPKDLHAEWKGIPDNINAVFTWRDGEIYMFKGNCFSVCLCVLSFVVISRR